jgi:hypothetical protein
VSGLPSRKTNFKTRGYPKKTKPVQLSRDGLPRFSWYVLSAPQADVKSALMKQLAIRLNEQTTLVKSLVMV